MKEIKTTDQLVEHLREDCEFYGYRADLEDRAELQRRAVKARALSVPDSLSRITQICLEQAGVSA